MVFMNYKAGGVTIKEAAVKMLDEKDQELIEALETVGVSIMSVSPLKDGKSCGIKS
jgi:hypothetical protein